MLNILNHWEMPIKTIMRDHCTSIRMSIIKKITSIDEDVEKGEPPCTIGGNENWCSHWGN